MMTSFVCRSITLTIASCEERSSTNVNSSLFPTTSVALIAFTASAISRREGTFGNARLPAVAVASPIELTFITASPMPRLRRRVHIGTGEAFATPANLPVVHCLAILNLDYSVLIGANRPDVNGHPAVHQDSENSARFLAMSVPRTAEAPTHARFKTFNKLPRSFSIFSCSSMTL